MQQALRLLQRHVDAPRRVRRLLQEDGVARDLADVDRDAFPLRGEDAVHDGDVLVGEIAGDAQDQDARLEGLAAVGVGAVVVGAHVCARGGRAGVGVGVVEGLAVDVGERESQGAGHHRGVGGGEVAFGGVGDQGAEVGHYGVFDEAEWSVLVCVVGGVGGIGDGAVGCVLALGPVECEWFLLRGLGFGDTVHHITVLGIVDGLLGRIIPSLAVTLGGWVEPLRPLGMTCYHCDSVGVVES